MSDLPSVTIKETVQNSFDALKGIYDEARANGDSLPENPVIRINIDKTKRIITIQDNGSGMTTEAVLEGFLRLAGSIKNTNRPSGGFGIAKMAFLFGNKALKLETTQGGIKTVLNTTGEELKDAIREGDVINKKLKIDRYKTSEANGTKVTITIPDTYYDPDH